MDIEIAPIIIFIYKREKKFRNLINILRYLKPKRLFIFCDGPKDETDRLLINKTRNVVSEVDWDVEISYKFSEKNLSAPIAIPTGLDWAFDNVDRCIVLEDDRIPDKTFFHFASYILDKYKNEPKIGYVSGVTPVTLKNIQGDYFFSKFYLLPTFGIWKNVWENRIKNYKYVSDKDYEKKISKVYNHKRFSERMIKEFKKQKYKMKNPNWDFMWRTTCLMNNLLTVYYKNNLTKSDGNDEFANHKNQFSTIFDKPPPIKKVEFPIIDPPEVVANPEFDKKVLKKYSLIPFIYRKLLQRLYRYF